MMTQKKVRWFYIFGVPATSEGIHIENDWNAFGMRGTGSQSIIMEDVFVPDSAIALRRKQGVWHPVWGCGTYGCYATYYVGLSRGCRSCF